MTTVRLQKLSKRFNTVLAVDNLTLEVEEGEFFSLLGPSGCGKTTTLRMIAGFETPDSGAIFFRDRDVTRIRPQDRHVGMVFQNYALFPHMTVGENVAFGLQARHLNKTTIAEKVAAALRLVDLAGFEKRPVTALSGGQQQRVALARALVIEPEILLLDEPLSNLDAKLRLETREQILALQRRLGITTFYVTHDQEEALSQSDRIAVLMGGRCVQVGTPRELYSRPANREVMAFLGKANFLPAEIIRSAEGRLVLQISPAWQIECDDVPRVSGRQITIGFRPHQVKLENPESDAMPRAEIKNLTYTGASEELTLEHEGLRFLVQRPSDEHSHPVRPGMRVAFSLSSECVRLFPPQDATPAAEVAG